MLPEASSQTGWEQTAALRWQGEQQKTPVSESHSVQQAALPRQGQTLGRPLLCTASESLSRESLSPQCAETGCNYPVSAQAGLTVS